MTECDIVQTYIGNWHNNNKQGLGRSVKVDGSMDFGRYDKGVFQAVPDVNYRVGGSVYGVDFSHYQKDVDWTIWLCIVIRMATYIMISLRTRSICNQCFLFI